MKQLGEFVALICGQASTCYFCLGAVRFLDKIGLPRWIEVPIFVAVVILCIWCCLKLMSIAEQAKHYDRDITYSNRQAAYWRAVYEETLQELNKAEEELFELQQAHSELSEEYNDLRDILLENGIDPDCPNN